MLPLMQATPPPPPPASGGYLVYLPVVMANNETIGQPAFSTVFCFDNEQSWCEPISGTEYTDTLHRRIYETNDEGIFNLFYTSLAVYERGSSYPWMLDDVGTVESLSEFDQRVSGSWIIILRMDGNIYFLSFL